MAEIAVRGINVSLIEVDPKFRVRRRNGYFRCQNAAAWGGPKISGPWRECVICCSNFVSCAWLVNAMPYSPGGGTPVEQYGHNQLHWEVCQGHQGDAVLVMGDLPPGEWQSAPVPQYVLILPWPFCLLGDCADPTMCCVVGYGLLV